MLEWALWNLAGMEVETPASFVFATPPPTTTTYHHTITITHHPPVQHPPPLIEEDERGEEWLGVSNWWTSFLKFREWSQYFFVKNNFLSRLENLTKLTSKMGFRITFVAIYVLSTYLCLWVCVCVFVMMCGAYVGGASLFVFVSAKAKKWKNLWARFSQPPSAVILF